MQREPLLRTGEIHVDQLERPRELAAECVAMHECGPRGRVPVLVVEGELEHPLEVRAVLAVVGAQRRELTLDESRRLAWVDRLEQGGKRIASSPDHLVAPARAGEAGESVQPFSNDRDALPGRDPVAHDNADFCLRSYGMNRLDYRADQHIEAIPAHASQGVLRHEERLGAAVDRDEQGPPIPVTRGAPHQLDQGIGRRATYPPQEAGAVRARSPQARPGEAAPRSR
jgi:hypothetical protein